MTAVLLALLGSAAHAVTSDDIELWVDADLTAYRHNKTAADISFDGYQIASEEGLDATGWDSINDRIPGRINELIVDLGAGALGFSELGSTPHQIAEGNLTGVGVLTANANYSLGKPFGEGGFWVYFSFQIGGIPTQFPEQAAVYVPRIPEPSTLILATLAGLGLVAMRGRTQALNQRPR